MTSVDEQFELHFREHGYFVQENVLSIDEVEKLRLALSAIPDGDEVRRKRGVYGIRNLFDVCPEIEKLAADDRIRGFAKSVLGDRVYSVRAIYFDKVAGANWSLFWHQDNVIAVEAKVEAPGYEAWSQKAGVWQVQPPVDILARVLTIRIHLDDCGTDNGPLRVLPGSHTHGWLDDELDEWKQNVDEVVCTVGIGGVVTMCPLTLHASAPAETVGHRRVIHLEYSADELPGPLRWRWRI